MKDCLVFLLCGVIFIEGQGAFGDEGCAYVVKDEKVIGLGGATNIFIMEEGEMKGACAEETRKQAEKIRRQMEASERKRNSVRYKVLTKLRGGRGKEDRETGCEVQ